MDDQKILPSTETIRRFHERVAALYEPSQGKGNTSRRYKKTASNRDISQYRVNEPAPTDAYFKEQLAYLLSLAASRPDTLVRMRRYVGQWARWIRIGLSTIRKFDTCVSSLLPSLSSCWGPGAEVLSLGNYC